MSSSEPRLVQTFLLDGTLEGVRIVDCESTVKAFVVPRLKLADVKNREELTWPSLYFLLGSDDNQAYIGESENFYDRVKNHDQKKQWWDLAIAVVSTTNTLEKGDVKYLESLAVERAHAGSVAIENKTVPARNTIHEFKLHKLQKILDDTQLILTLLGYDLLSSPKAKAEQVWHCNTKKTKAKAVFRGDKFVVLAGSVVDKSHAESWARDHENEVIERDFVFDKYGVDQGDIVEIENNIGFISPNHAGRIICGRSVNAWTTWKNEAGQTMDEVMRRGA